MIPFFVGGLHNYATTGNINVLMDTTKNTKIKKK